MIKKIILLSAFFTICSLGFSQTAADGTISTDQSDAATELGTPDNAAQAERNDKKAAKKATKKKACAKKKKKCCSKKKACHKKKD